MIKKVHPPTFLRFCRPTGCRRHALALFRFAWPAFSLLIAVFLLLFSLSTAYAVDCNAVRAKYHCPVKKHKLHLSFDDGVGSVTPKILDILKREHIKATFLILGNKIDCGKYQAGTRSYKLCQQRLATLKRIKREGHEIGSHSYEHYHHSKLTPAQLQQTIAHSRQLLEPYFTTQPAIFRLPYGDGWFNQKQAPQVMQALKRNGFEHLGWEMTAYDWNEKYQHGDQILDNVMKQMCGGKGRDGVVLFHDGVFENEHEGRVFTANNLARWIPQMRCAADFVPLLSVKGRQFKRK